MEINRRRNLHVVQQLLHIGDHFTGGPTKGGQAHGDDSLLIDAIDLWSSCLLLDRGNITQPDNSALGGLDRNILKFRDGVSVLLRQPYSDVVLLTLFPVL